MAKDNGRLKSAAVKIGTAAGKADRTAHDAAAKVLRAADVAREELQELTRQVDELKRQLAKSSGRLRDALR